MSVEAGNQGRTPAVGSFGERVVGAAAIALVASLVDPERGGGLGRTARLRGPDRGGARLPRGAPGRGRDRGRLRRR